MAATAPVNVSNANERATMGHGLVATSDIVAQKHHMFPGQGDQ